MTDRQAMAFALGLARGEAKTRQLLEDRFGHAETLRAATLFGVLEADSDPIPAGAGKLALAAEPFIAQPIPPMLAHELAQARNAPEDHKQPDTSTP